jgi:demethylmenaquinone methyltransferase/2-methoxy-6-polyprenyl-1,4-benzoquinol methylase
MTVGFLELIQAELTDTSAIVEKTFKIKSGHLSQYAHTETESVQQFLHPAIVLLSGKILQYTCEKLVYLASVIQLIYIASKIHFRIPDDYDRQAGIDPRDGAPLPVLAGDYLYGKYFEGLCVGGILEFLSPLAEIIAEMNHGALLRKKNFDRPVSDRELEMVIIRKEAASLTEGAAKFAGLLAGGNEGQVKLLAEFGTNLGMAVGILERNLEKSTAEPFFNKSIRALKALPGSSARDCLEQITEKIKSGELAVPKNDALRHELNGRQIGDIAISEQYKNKEEYVHSIFSGIAKKYDSLNTLLSFNQDRYWRKFTVEQTGLKPGGQVLDVCCGTGMITFELARKVGSEGKVTGLDFCGEMLDVARKNLTGSMYEKNIEFVQDNATELPFPDNGFDCVTIGFGLRNVPDMKKTIREMTRVIKPGGKVVCLEFSKPKVPVFKQIYNFYFEKWVPFLGKIGVGADGPYRYLHSSWKAFPHQQELRDEFLCQGLENVEFYELTGGIVSVHVGVKPIETTISSVAATQG